MKKYFLIIGGVTLLAAVLYLVYQVATFDLFLEEKKLLEEFTLNAKEYKVYYLGGNATTQEVIQIMGENGDGEYLVRAIEGYNKLEKLQIVNDSTINLIVRDDSFEMNESDTLVVRI